MREKKKSIIDQKKTRVNEYNRTKFAMQLYTPYAYCAILFRMTVKCAYV